MYRMPATYAEAVEMAMAVDNATARPGLGFVDGYHGDHFRESWARFEVYRVAYSRGREAARLDAARKGT